MTAAELLADYRSFCLQAITVRRYATVGAVRTKKDFTAKGNCQFYSAKQLTDTIFQGDRRVIVLAGDLQGAGLTLPVTNADKVVDQGRECAVIVPAERRALDGTLIAYELQIRG